MKTRRNFVSNSSSSSFICTSEDLDKISVYGDVCHYDVRRYVEERWRDDLFGAWGTPLAKVRFEPDEKYAAGFGSNSLGALPESARGVYGEYEAAYSRAIAAQGEERAKAWQDVRRLEKDVADAIWTALEPKWKDVVLAEVIASDDNGDEESMYDSFGSLHDPTFYRTFNNH